MGDDGNVERLGQFIREQRKRANLSLRDLAARASVSNPYLSQIERGLHEPSVRVLKSIAVALKIPAVTLLAEAGLVDEADWPNTAPATEIAIISDSELSEDQQADLLMRYRKYRTANATSVGASAD